MWKTAAPGGGGQYFMLPKATHEVDIIWRSTSSQN